MPAGDYYKWFYTRRALRILPLYFTMLLVVGSIMWWAGETSLAVSRGERGVPPEYRAACRAGGPPGPSRSCGRWESRSRCIWSGRSSCALLHVSPARVAVRGGWPRRTVPSLRDVHGGLAARRSVDRDVAPARRLRLGRPARDRHSRAAHDPQRVSAPSASGRMVISVGLAACCARRAASRSARRLEASLQLACADLFFAGLVAVCVVAPSGRAGGAAAWRAGLRSAASATASISCTMFVFWSFDRLAAVSSPMTLAPTVLRALIVLAVSTAIAELSWRYIEGPSLELKPAFARTGRREIRLMRILITADPYIPVPPAALRRHRAGDRCPRRASSSGAATTSRSSRTPTAARRPVWCRTASRRTSAIGSARRSWCRSGARSGASVATWTSSTASAGSRRCCRFCRGVSCRRSRAISATACRGRAWPARSGWPGRRSCSPDVPRACTGTGRSISATGGEWRTVFNCVDIATYTPRAVGAGRMRRSSFSGASIPSRARTTRLRSPAARAAGS